MTIITLVLFKMLHLLTHLIRVKFTFEILSSMKYSVEFKLIFPF